MSFTGSSDVGRHLKSISGRKRVGLVLGGNAAAIVHEDGGLEYAAGRIVLDGFTNAGQNCISVHELKPEESEKKDRSNEGKTTLFSRRQVANRRQDQ